MAPTSLRRLASVVAVAFAVTAASVAAGPPAAGDAADHGSPATVGLTLRADLLDLVSVQTTLR